MAKVNSDLCNIEYDKLNMKHSIYKKSYEWIIINAIGS